MDYCFCSAIVLEATPKSTGRLNCGEATALEFDRVPAGVFH
jgi:hypothetical protein